MDAWTRRGLGCLALWAVLGSFASVHAQEVIRCASVDGHYERCDTHWRDAEVMRQESNASCDRGMSWDFDHGSVWVDHGCRALFREARRGFHRGDVDLDGYGRPIAPARPAPGGFDGWREEFPARSHDRGMEFHRRSRDDRGANGHSRRSPPGARLVQCGSVNKAYRFCPAGINDKQQVVLENNQSDKRCKWARDWGVKDGGIWVSNGCRAVFSIR
jgi:DUF3011 family protein